MTRKKKTKGPARPDPLDIIRAALVKGHGKDAVGTFAGGILPDLVVIPTGLSVLDRYVLGCGGLPVGRIVELYAQESGGKTSLALQCVAGAQRAGFPVCFTETEHALQTSRASTFGVDRDRALLLPAIHVEQVMERAGTILKATTVPTLWVWDSIAATPSQLEYKGGLSKKKASDDRAKTLSWACRVMSGQLAHQQVCALLVNQTRTKRGVMFGDPTTTPGGDAVKFHSSVRLQLWPGAVVKSKGIPVGRVVTVKATKNKLSIPGLKAKILLNYVTGWDERWSVVNLAKELELVPQHAKRDAYDDALARLEEAGWGLPTGAAEPDEDDAEEGADGAEE